MGKICKDCGNDQDNNNRSDEGETRSLGFDWGWWVSHWSLIGADVGCLTDL